MEQQNISVNHVNKGDEWTLLLNILHHLKQKIHLIGLGTLVGIVAGLLLSTFIVPPKYTAFLDLYVTNASKVESDVVNINDLTAAQKLVNTYIVMLQANTVTDRVIEEIGREDFTQEQLLKNVTFSSVNATEVLRITAKVEDPELAVDICRAYQNIASEVLESIVGAGSVKVISTPVLPQTPSSPNKAKYTLFGAILGMLSVAALVSVEMFFDRTITDESMLSENYAIPVLGTVPDFFLFSKTLGISKKDVKKSKRLKSKNEKNEKIFTVATVLNEDTPFPISEAHNTIRSNMLFSSELQTGVIVVTSPNANDLKTTTSINLAISLTQMGAKVLLIDADLRNPSIYRQFKIGNKRGLSSVLVGYDRFEDAIVTNVVPKLDFLPAGPMPPRPAELLGSSAMIEFMSACADQYDFTIIDTSPVNVVSDALVMSGESDGIVLVTRAKKTRYNELDKAIKTVSIAKANIIGLVLTDTDIHDSSYGYRQYGYDQKTTNI